MERKWKIVTFNVQTAQDPSGIAMLLVSPEMRAELVCLQEDLEPVDWNYETRGAYSVAVKGPAEDIEGRGRLCNTILVRSDVAKDVQSSSWFDVTENGETNRSVSAVDFRGCLVANLHLCGGRFDDLRFRKTKYAKARQIWSAMGFIDAHFGKLPDVVVGDMNSERNESDALQTLSNYPIFKETLHKKEFLEWYLCAHEALTIHGYDPAFSERDVRPTSAYGGVPDWVYVGMDWRASGNPVVRWGLKGKPPVSDHALVSVVLQRKCSTSQKFK